MVLWLFKVYEGEDNEVRTKNYEIKIPDAILKIEPLFSLSRSDKSQYLVLGDMLAILPEVEVCV